jgi:hypothetical protein
MTSGPYLVEEVIKRSGYEGWADKYVSEQTRRRFFSPWLALLGILVASFMAFNDEHTTRLEAEKRLAEKVLARRKMVKKTYSIPSCTKLSIKRLPASGQPTPS